MEAAEALITGARHTPPMTDSGQGDDETIALLRDLVQRLSGRADLTGSLVAHIATPRDRLHGSPLA
jgi:hypothetical protein